jgi:hypothetical protein
MEKYMKTKKPAAWITEARKMPPRQHTKPGEPFDAGQSDAIAWLIKHTSLASNIMGRLQRSLVFDKASGTWRGIDYEPEGE